MNIGHCFQTGSVVTDLASTDKFEALTELIRSAPVFQEIEGRDFFERAVVERERLQTTGLGHGVAVAHGRADGVPRVLIGLGISRRGIAFDAPDGQPVRLLFVIASPSHVSLDYLHALSTLVRCVRHQHVREALLAAGEAHGIEAGIRDAFRLELQRLSDPQPGRQPCEAAG
jgi:nitrogen PTS system EIIA component